MNSCSQGRTLQQVNNTCWFHTAVNGFLFSRKGRQILWDAYREYKGPLKPSNTCSRRGVLPLDQFWAFVVARLEKRHVSTSETNVIHELRPYSDISSGNGTDVVLLCQKVFGQVNLFGMAHRFEEWRISKSKIVSGAMIGRTSFRGDILYSIGITGFIYPIIGHWAWGPGGVLAVYGFWDFAGSTVVHTIGGVASLAGAIVLGPRLGRIFKRDGGGMPPAHNLTLGAVGAFILWFGWYGFNPGSTLSAVDMQGIGRVATNTTLAACSGGMVAMYLALWFGDTKGKFDLGFTVNGVLGGLVAITCPCYWVNTFGAVAIGAGAGLVVYLVTNLLEYLRIDDPIGAVPVHGAAGIWGTWALGLFACGKFGVTGPTGADNSAPLKGLLYGGGTDLLTKQVVGNLAIVVATFAVSFILMWVINKLPNPWKLRVEPEGETLGLDVFEHGSEAYTA